MIDWFRARTKRTQLYRMINLITAAVAAILVARQHHTLG
jgi:hypothetical protein